MYERSAIVLERYLNNVFEFDKKSNLKQNFKNFKNIVEEIEKYQIIVEEEEKVINEFDSKAMEIENIQKKQSKLYDSNIELEKERNQLFNSFDEKPENVEKKLNKIEEKLEENNDNYKQLRDMFVEGLTEFSKREKERNKWSKSRRVAEAERIEFIKLATKEVENISIETVKKLKDFSTLENDEIEQELNEAMVKNGKDERVSFDKEVLQKAVTARVSIAKKEAECYCLIYDKIKRLLAEINNDNMKILKYQKVLKNITVKLAFLEAEKRYIVSFLDNERLTAINGNKIHKKMMKEACENFELDIAQINNLYELILLEISKKATKKAYTTLYNKTYLREIEEKEKKFEKEVNNIKINTGTIINSNYWRIEEIKNIYEVFQEEVSEKFEKDLEEYRLEELEEENNRYKNNNVDDEEDNYFNDIENEENDNDENDNDVEYDDEYEDEDYEDDEEDDQYEENDDEYEDDDEYEEDDIEKASIEKDSEEENEDYDNKIVIERAKNKKTKNKKDKKQSKGLFNKIFKEKKK